MTAGSSRSFSEGLVRRFEIPGGGAGRMVSLAALQDKGWGRIARLPVSLRIVLEALARNCDGQRVHEDQVRALADWRPNGSRTVELPFVVSRVLLQDLSGLPVLNDLAAMRAEARKRGIDPAGIQPLVPVDLVVDHAVSVDVHGRPDALLENIRHEYARNSERLLLLRWAQQAVGNLNVVPPGNGIVHQVNLERLARGVFEAGGLTYPDTMVGTDSHSTMVNGIGVLGWGVGGLEAFAAMLGEPVGLLIPDVVGVHLHGILRPGVTATDLALTVTERLRAVGVVNKFVEYHGAGARTLSVADRATLANMAPDYGATCGFFAVDERTIDYLLATGREPQQVLAVRSYLGAQGLFGIPLAGDCDYSEVVDIDLGRVGASVAGPSRPEQRADLSALPARFEAFMRERGGSDAGRPPPGAPADGRSPGAGEPVVRHGDVVIAAITSCTTTSNPRLMLAAGLLARNAAALGMTVPRHVKTSLAPGSMAVGEYLRRAGLLPALETLGFHIVAHGCTTCMGNSGPLNPGVEAVIARDGVLACAVLSGNRNFEGRIHDAVRANFLMSPALVVAHALAGTVRLDLEREPIGPGKDGRPVFLHELMPSDAEVERLLGHAADPALYREVYGNLGFGQADWDAVPIRSGPLFSWPTGSTYLVEPPFFALPTADAEATFALAGARLLAVLGDSITTDHITPNGRIRPNSPAGRWLRDFCRVSDADLNTYAMRRCNHDVMVRGAFDHPGLRNTLAGDVAGGVTRMLPDGDVISIFDAAMHYRQLGAPLVVVAGREYGTGSSRDWAARAPALLGVRAVLANGFERIHRSNLVGMGILPCELPRDVRPQDLDLDGTEVLDFQGIAGAVEPRQEITLVLRRPGLATVRTLPLYLRVDTGLEAAYVRDRGLLPYVFRKQAGHEALADRAPVP